MESILLFLISLLALIGMGYLFYNMWFVYPKRFGVPYLIRFNGVDSPPDLSQNAYFKNKIKIVSHSSDDMTWVVKGVKINERVIKAKLMADYDLADAQVNITSEARHAYEYSSAVS